MRRKRLLSVTALMLTASMVFTGCMSSTVKKNAEQNEPASAPEAVAENNTSEAVSDEEGEAEEAYTDIVLWDDSTDGDANTLFQELADGFAEKYGVNVERVVIKGEDLRTTVKAAINSGEGPDIFTYDSGAGYLGVLAKSGLAYDLTAVAEQDSWNDLFKESALDACTFDGKLYGVGNQLESVGVYYLSLIHI